MAELLVRRIDRKNITWMQLKKPTEVDAVCSRAGDIISIREDGQGWGNAEGPPEYIRLKLLGILAETIKQYIKPKVDGDTVLFRRRFKILNIEAYNDFDTISVVNIRSK